MRHIEGQLSRELKAALGEEPIPKARAFRVSSYRDLVQHVARLSYANKDHLLFFRGQATEYRNKAGSSSFYPSIYRGERLSRSGLVPLGQLVDRARWL